MVKCWDLEVNKASAIITTSFLAFTHSAFIPRWMCSSLPVATHPHELGHGTKAQIHTLVVTLERWQMLNAGSDLKSSRQHGFNRPPVGPCSG